MFEILDNDYRIIAMRGGLWHNEVFRFRIT
jgi:hypothetical protein